MKNIEFSEFEFFNKFEFFEKIEFLEKKLNF